MGWYFATCVVLVCGKIECGRTRRDTQGGRWHILGECAFVVGSWDEPRDLEFSESS